MTEHENACWYSAADEASLLQAVPRMMREAEELRRLYVAPTELQRRAISVVVLDFVRRRGRKVYGGHALNAALLEVSPGDAFYGPSAAAAAAAAAGEGGESNKTAGTPDIEFYSPDPIADVVELCNRLFAAGHRYVQGREAMHHGTFTISVEFTRVCDVTHFPRPAYDRLPVRVFPPASVLGVDFDEDGGPGVQMVDPTFAAIDLMKLLCDPFTSYWKLDRMLPRLMLIQRHFPQLPAANAGPADVTSTSTSTSMRVPTEPEATALRAALAWAANRGTMAVVGEHALAYFEDWADAFQAGGWTGIRARAGDVRRLTLVSVDYGADLEALASFLDAVLDQPPQPEQQHVPKITEHNPFTDLLGRRATLRLRSGGAPLLTLIDARGKVVPICGRGCDGAMVASIAYVSMTAMAMRFLASVDGKRVAEAEHARTVIALTEARRRGLAATGLTVADIGTPFRDTMLEHIGEPRTEMRIHMDGVDDRRVRAGPSAQVWFTYDPNRPKGGGVGGGSRGRGGRGRGRGQQQQQHQAFALARCDGQPVAQADSVLMARHVERSLGTGATAAT
jgi:hypothetical protein